MRVKIASLIALAVIIIVAISYFIHFRHTHRDSRPSYERTIIRNTRTVEEANALAIAENASYTSIFGLKRFYTGGAYVWANFIDAQVLDYYDDRFENLKGQLGDGKPQSVELYYEANVFTWDQIRVIYVPAPEGASMDDDAIQVLSPNGSVLFENARSTGPGWGMKFAYRHDSAYQRITAEGINFSLSETYVIEMRFGYVEIYGPLAAFMVKNYQIILVDQDLTPFLLCTQSKQRIS